MIVSVNKPQGKYNLMNAQLRGNSIPPTDLEFVDVNDLYETISKYILPGYTMLSIYDNMGVSKGIVFQNLVSGEFFEFGSIDDATYNYLNDAGIPNYTPIKNIYVRQNFTDLYKYLSSCKYIITANKLIEVGLSDFNKLFADMSSYLRVGLSSNSMNLNYDELKSKYNLLGFSNVIESNVDNFKYYVANKIYDKMEDMCLVDIMSDCESMSNDNVSYVIDNLGPEFSVRLLIYKNVGRE